MLDNSQMEAVQNIKDNILLIAGAGSGKTYTIVNKIKYLLEHGYKEKEILCISLTNETVNNLKNKLSNIDVYTFHRLSLNIINDKDISIVNPNYLSYIIDEYFKSYLSFNDKYIIKLLFKRYSYNYIKNTLITLIHYIKTNNISNHYLYIKFKYSFGHTKTFMRCLIQILKIYESDLESSKKIDFDNMISLATKLVKTKKLPYKYIIIDEFQDTSLIRLNLILEIIKYTNALLFVVGDDYQSIYKFSGCNINLFLNLNNYIDIKIMKLKYTYRNSQELANIATSFIMKNKKQLKKEIISSNNINKPIVICKNKTLDEIIPLINDEDILVIGRTNKDIENIELPALTIHKSKGLEAKFIILINSDNIPLKDRDNTLINKIISNKEYIINEEERRLFYVALTRAKERIYIQVNKKMSPFIKELIKDYKQNIEFIS